MISVKSQIRESLVLEISGSCICDLLVRPSLRALRLLTACFSCVAELAKVQGPGTG